MIYNLGLKEIEKHVEAKKAKADRKAERDRIREEKRLAKKAKAEAKEAERLRILAEEEKARKREEEKKLGEYFESQWDSGTHSSDLGDSDNERFIDDGFVEDSKAAAEDYVNNTDIGITYLSDSSELTSEDEYDNFLNNSFEPAPASSNDYNINWSSDSDVTGSTYDSDSDEDLDSGSGSSDSGSEYSNSEDSSY